jgi:hypothetical protein
MPRYRSKPTEIVAVQFLDVENPPPGVYRHEVFDSFYVVTKQGNAVGIKPGEWVAEESGNRTRHYPIADHIFRARWELID